LTFGQSLAAGGAAILLYEQQSTTNDVYGFGIAPNAMETFLPAAAGYAARCSWNAGGFQSNADTSALMTLWNNAHLIVGGSADAGFVLDVQGTMRTTGVNRLDNLAGVGDRMVVAQTDGTLITQAIPSGGGGYNGQSLVPLADISYTVGSIANRFASVFTATINGLQTITGSTTLAIRTGGTSNALTFHNGTTERARFAATSGNLLVGTTTDSGFKLEVNGNTRINGDLTTGNRINIGDPSYPIGVLLNSGTDLYIDAYGGGMTSKIHFRTALATVQMMTLMDTGGVRMNYLPYFEYADNAAAVAAGKLVGELYHTGGIVKVVTP
jgi:hypothetical protein